VRALRSYNVTQLLLYLPQWSPWFGLGESVTPTQAHGRTKTSRIIVEIPQPRRLPGPRQSSTNNLRYSVTVFLHFDNWPRISGKAAPEHSQIALPRASNAPWSRWRSSSVSTFMHSLTRFREPKCSEFLQTERPQLMCKGYEYGGTLLRPIHPSLVIAMSSHCYLFLGGVSSSGTDGKSLPLNLMASISTKSPRALQD
jgi:hypothetical protein